MGRLLPLSGVAFVVIALVAVLLGGDSPDSSSSASEIATYFDDHDIRQVISALLLAASVPFLIVFAVGLGGGTTSELRSWGYVLISGAGLTGAVLLILAVVQFALADGATKDVTAPAALQALSLIESDGWVGFNAGLGVMMLGAAGCLIPRSRAWIGWVALVLGVLLFIPFADFFALILTLVWILVVSVLQVRAGPGAPAVASV